MTKKDLFRFDKENVWSYGTGKIKVFIPKTLNKGFGVFCKHNNIKPQHSCEYKYQNDKQEKKDIENGLLLVGDDFILEIEHQTKLIKWLKKSYKEIKI